MENAVKTMQSLLTTGAEKSELCISQMNTMDRLTKIPFFHILEDPGSIAGSEELVPAYKEYMYRLMDICIGTKQSIPSFFVLNYTLSELIVLQQRRESEPHSLIDFYISKAILATESAVKWSESHESNYSYKTQAPDTNDFIPKWTADVIDLIEMAMALHERKAINNGEVSITAVVNFFFNLFNMKPGNFFSTYGVMRTRADSRTLFLDELKRVLENKMDRDDEKELKRNKRKL